MLLIAVVAVSSCSLDVGMDSELHSVHLKQSGISHKCLDVKWIEPKLQGPRGRVIVGQSLFATLIPWLLLSCL